MRDASGNLTISWIRRSRVDGDWRDGVDVPLAEEFERYEVEIMQGATVKRVISGLTSASTTYTSAEQIADFGSNQASVSVKIYQLSSVVGRGYAGFANV